MSLSMFFLIFLSIHLSPSNGIPLESPSADLSKYFSRIVGGEEAPKAFAPYMVALVATEYMTMFVCGASLISTTHVLTAAHCIEMFVIWGELLPSYRAILGTNDWHHKGTEAKVTEFHIHPEWDPRFIKHDAGILVLEKNVELSDKVGVIALNFDWIDGGEDAYITGWGRLGTWGVIPYKLQMLFVKTLSPKQCVVDLLEAPEWGAFPPTLNEEIEICTFHSDGHGMCHGDSGSPLVHTETNQQIAIGSWGYPCGRGLPDVYVRLSGVKLFIDEVLSKHSTTI